MRCSHLGPPHLRTVFGGDSLSLLRTAHDRGTAPPPHLELTRRERLRRAGHGLVSELRLPSFSSPLGGGGRRPEGIKAAFDSRPHVLGRGTFAATGAGARTSAGTSRGGARAGSACTRRAAAQAASGARGRARSKGMEDPGLGDGKGRRGWRQPTGNIVLNLLNRQVLDCIPNMFFSAHAA